MEKTMKGNDEDLSRINQFDSLTVLTSSNFKLIIILQMLSFLIMIGASTVVSAKTPTLVSSAACPREYKFQNNSCIAKRASYAPESYPICGARGTYYSATGQCGVVNDALGLLALEPGSAEVYDASSCLKGFTQDGGTCIQRCLRTHRMKNGKCRVISSKIGIENMICPGRTHRRGTKCFDPDGAKVFKYSLFFDCDHPSISNEWTKSTVIATLRDEKGELIQTTTLKKNVLGKGACTNKLIQNTITAWSTETFNQARYLLLATKGGDGLYIDALRLQVNSKLVKWGKNGGKGWCMSTQPKDGGGSWKKFTGNNCYRSLLFNIKTGKVKTLK